MVWHPQVPTNALQGLYAIVDLPHPNGLDPVAVTRALLGNRVDGGEHGAAIVQLRAKSATTQQRIDWLGAMAPVCQQAGVPLVANDDLRAAAEVPEVAGVHLGQDDIGVDDLAQVRRTRQDLIVGISTHDLQQLRAALKRKPDYVAFGPVATTRSKHNPDPVVGFGGLADAGRVASIPLVAIGGLDAARAQRAIRYGASMAAVIGALTHSTVEATRAAAVALAQALQQAARRMTVSEVAEMIPVLDRDLFTDLARWGDSFSLQMALELPARFAPAFVDGVASYRYCEILDLLRALGKRPSETWEQWKRRGHDESTVVQLRARK